MSLLFSYIILSDKHTVFFYTILMNFSTKYILMYKVFIDEGMSHKISGVTLTYTSRITITKKYK